MITALKSYLLHAAGIFVVFPLVFITYNVVSKSKSRKSVSLKADLKDAVHSKVFPQPCYCPLCFYISLFHLGLVFILS